MPDAVFPVTSYPQNPTDGGTHLQLDAIAFRFRWRPAPDFNPPTSGLKWVLQVFTRGDWQSLKEFDSCYGVADADWISGDKNNNVYFRVILKDRPEIGSNVVSPFGVWSERECNYAREIHRRMNGASEISAGRACNIWLRNTDGLVCTACMDVLSRSSKDSNCPHCFGTGKSPAYIGPIGIMVQFQPGQKSTQMTESADGTVQPRDMQAILPLQIELNTSDIVEDCHNRRFYAIKVSQAVAAMRGVPIVQKLTVSECAKTEPIYKLYRNP